ncbi:MAG TPA: TIGR02587 family membrane protein [Propylenella sp.]|nr:TIGR02587 family membrane protein [Propylenella sp.]
MASRAKRSGSLRFATGLARAFGGAVLFAFPLLMTMEMWQLGFSMSRLRLALFIAITLPVLFGLSYYSGFEKTETRAEDAEDAFVAFGVGFIAAALMLALFGMITWDMPLGEIFGKIGIQTVPASIGAIVASKQFHAGGGEDDEEEEEKRASYPGELFLMTAGAIFVAFNVAPTEEMLLIAFTMTSWHAVALALVSVLMLHGFVYTVGFAGQEEPPGYAGFWLTFLHFTIAGYGIALLVSLYVLWTFERTVDVHFAEVAMMMVVMAFPASLGAAMARLVV